MSTQKTFQPAEITLEVIARKIDNMDTKFAQIDTRFDQIDKRFDSMDNRIDYLYVKIEKDIEDLAAMTARGFHELKAHSTHEHIRYS